LAQKTADFPAIAIKLGGRVFIAAFKVIRRTS